MLSLDMSQACILCDAATRASRVRWDAGPAHACGGMTFCCLESGSARVSYMHSSRKNFRNFARNRPDNVQFNFVRKSCRGIFFR